MDNIKVIANNKKAYHDYFVLEKYEAGIELAGTEVKSLRQGRCNLKDSWCSIVKGEIYVNGLHISPYEHGNIFGKDPMRVRKLLMHKREINKLFGTLQQQGLSLIPLSYILRAVSSSLNLAFAKAKSFMISVRQPRKGALNAILIEL